MARDRPIAFESSRRGIRRQLLDRQVPDGGGEFDEVLDIGEFRLDPAFAPRKDELAKTPVNVVLEAFWCATQESAGLEIVNVETSSPGSVGP